MRNTFYRVLDVLAVGKEENVSMLLEHFLHLILNTSTVNSFRWQAA